MPEPAKSSRHDRLENAPADRVEQKRSVRTRAVILQSAIAEFAKGGFHGASIRAIALRSGVPHALITYHFQTKDLLWRAAAEKAFGEIRAEWDTIDRTGLDALQVLRAEYGALFRFTVSFPEFHRFMDQETDRGNPRLVWVTENVVGPMISRLLPQIEEAQERGLLPPAPAILFHYMLVSLSATLSRFGPEMEMTSGVDPDARSTTVAYWQLVETFMFGSFLAPSGQPAAETIGQVQPRGSKNT